MGAIPSKESLRRGIIRDPVCSCLHDGDSLNIFSSYSTERRASNGKCVCNSPARQHYLVLIPLIPEYFPSSTCLLFEQLLKVRREPSVSYYYRDARSVPCSDPSVIPPTASDKAVYNFYMSLSQQRLVETDSDLIALHRAGHVFTPVPCAVAFIQEYRCSAKRLVEAKNTDNSTAHESVSDGDRCTGQGSTNFESASWMGAADKPHHSSDKKLNNKDDKDGAQENEHLSYLFHSLTSVYGSAVTVTCNSSHTNNSNSNNRNSVSTQPSISAGASSPTQTRRRQRNRSCASALAKPSAHRDMSAGNDEGEAAETESMLLSEPPCAPTLHHTKHSRPVRSISVRVVGFVGDTNSCPATLSATTAAKSPIGFTLYLSRSAGGNYRLPIALLSAYTYVTQLRQIGIVDPRMQHIFRDPEALSDCNVASSCHEDLAQGKYNQPRSEAASKTSGSSDMGTYRLLSASSPSATLHRNEKASMDTTRMPSALSLPCMTVMHTDDTYAHMQAREDSYSSCYNDDIYSAMYAQTVESTAYVDRLCPSQSNSAVQRTSLGAACSAATAGAGAPAAKMRNEQMSFGVPQLSMSCKTVSLSPVLARPIQFIFHRTDIPQLCFLRELRTRLGRRSDNSTTPPLSTKTEKQRQHNSRCDDNDRTTLDKFPTIVDFDLSSAYGLHSNILQTYIAGGDLHGNIAVADTDALLYWAAEFYMLHYNELTGSKAFAVRSHLAQCNESVSRLDCNIYFTAYDPCQRMIGGSDENDNEECVHPVHALHAGRPFFYSQEDDEYDNKMYHLQRFLSIHPTTARANHSQCVDGNERQRIGEGKEGGGDTGTKDAGGLTLENSAFESTAFVPTLPVRITKGDVWIPSHSVYLHVRTADSMNKASTVGCHRRGAQVGMSDTLNHINHHRTAQPAQAMYSDEQTTHYSRYDSLINASGRADDGAREMGALSADATTRMVLAGTVLLYDGHSWLRDEKNFAEDMLLALNRRVCKEARAAAPECVNWLRDASTKIPLNIEKNVAIWGKLYANQPMFYILTPIFVKEWMKHSKNIAQCYETYMSRLNDDDATRNNNNNETTNAGADDTKNTNGSNKNSSNNNNNSRNNFNDNIDNEDNINHTNCIKYNKSYYNYNDNNNSRANESSIGENICGEVVVTRSALPILPWSSNSRMVSVASGAHLSPGRSPAKNVRSSQTMLRCVFDFSSSLSPSHNFASGETAVDSVQKIRRGSAMTKAPPQSVLRLSQPAIDIAPTSHFFSYDHNLLAHTAASSAHGMSPVDGLHKHCATHHDNRDDSYDACAVHSRRSYPTTAVLQASSPVQLKPSTHESMRGNSESGSMSGYLETEPIDIQGCYEEIVHARSMSRRNSRYGLLKLTSCITPCVTRKDSLLSVCLRTCASDTVEQPKSCSVSLRVTVRTGRGAHQNSASNLLSKSLH